MKYINNILQLLILILFIFSSCKDKQEDAHTGVVKGSVIVLDGNGEVINDYDHSSIELKLNGKVKFPGEGDINLELTDTCGFDGAYKFENLNNDQDYYVYVNSPDFLKRVKLCKSNGSSDTLILRMTMGTPFRIRCSVVFKDYPGQPVSNAEVYLYQSEFARDQDTFFLKSDRSLKTNNQGAVTFEGLKEGIYYLKARYEFNKVNIYKGNGAPVTLIPNQPDQPCPIELKK